MAPETEPLAGDGLQPLRGPLGWRQVLFTHRDLPVRAAARVSWRLRGLIAACWLVLLFVFSYESKIYLGEMMLLLVWVWIGSEFGVIFVVGWLTAPARAMRRQGQLAELTLTMLRPIEIAQFMLARRLRLALEALAAGVLALGFFVLQMLILGPYSLVLLPAVILVGLNAALTLYLWSWMRLAFLLSGRSVLGRLRAELSFMAMLALVGLWLAMLFLVPVLWIENSSPTPSMSHWKEVLFYSILLVVVLPFWLVKYALARAWAARIEQALLHRVEY